MSTDPVIRGGGRRAMFLVGAALVASAAVAIARHPSPAAIGQVTQAAPPPAPAALVAAAQAKTGGSFFDPFDRIDTTRWFLSDGWVNGDIQGCAWSRTNVNISKGVLQLILAKANDRLRPYRCAEMRTHATLGYGTYEVRMRTAKGSGLNSNMFTYSGPPLTPYHDELDFEFLGRDSSTVQLNYYLSGKGGHEVSPRLGFDAAASFNNYAFVWEPGRARWYINGRLVRDEHGAGLPVMPGNFFLSLWNGTKMVDGWLGAFDPGQTPAVAEYDWAAFTRAGERCRFPESITCKLT